jgi:uncharacterized membrane protein
MKKINNKILIWTLVVAIITAIIIFFLDKNNSLVSILRIIFWSIFILFLPWYFLTLSFFEDSEIDLLERFALSFALSISVVPLLSFYLNLVWVKINEISVYLIVVFVIIANIFYINFFKNKKWKLA